MLVIVPFSAGDWEQARDLFTWILELDGARCPAKKHFCLLVASKGMEEHQWKSVMLAAQHAYERVIIITPFRADETGWPVSCNNLFRTAAKWVRQVGRRPFWWNEPDCIPLKKDWLSKIERAYKVADMPFLGTICDQPFSHLTGCAVYPEDVAKYNPECLQDDITAAWDCVAQEKTIPHAASDPFMFQQVWGNQTNNIAPTFPNQRSLRIIERNP